MTAPSLHVEYLLNIRQIVAYATFHSGYDASSRVYFSTDRTALNIDHDGQTRTATFPRGVHVASNATCPRISTSQLSLRFEIDGKSTVHGQAPTDSLDDPWSATFLSTTTGLACDSCKSVIVDSRTVSWRDLPHEDWAEMMDFWHCHKPDDGHGPHTNAKFDASSRPVARSGVGLVDTCYVIVDRDNCTGLAVDDNTGQIHCHCSHELGTIDEAHEGTRLYKWAVAVQATDHTVWHSIPLQHILSVYILQMIDRQGERKFLVFDESARATVAQATEENTDTKTTTTTTTTRDKKTTAARLLLWILNPDLYYSNTTVAQGQAQRVMKVLYKSGAALDRKAGNGDNSDNSDNSNDDDNTAYSEELFLPASAIDSLAHSLARANGLLPGEMQLLHGWRVGLVHRAA